ncbi:MAG: NADH dehydrogenase (quinone) subunit D [Proteobacteria bacterium]|nr:NADH dehydrogenase (quinone) subunit D [Pseudomonadota bacterium]
MAAPTIAAETAGSEHLILNMGPQHPSTHGVLRVILELDGEVIVNAEPVIGHLHRGVEKLAEHMTYNQVIPLMDRLDYCSPLINNLGYVLAVEKLLGIEIPERAVALRVLLSELTRIQSHLIWLGTHALDIGAMSPLLYMFREREEILDMYEEVWGARMHLAYFRVGGVAADVPKSFLVRARKFLSGFYEKVDMYEALLTENPIWKRRTQGVGIISGDDAIALGLSGPGLRASGIDWDLRKHLPYSGYDRYEFEVPRGTRGDVYDRYLVRIAEMRQATRICVQALEGLPGGPVLAAAPRVVPPEKERVLTTIEGLIHHFKIMMEGYSVPEGEVYAAVESPRGELGFYIRSDGGPKPYRLKVRTPSFANLESLCTMAKGQMIADMVAIIGSIDIVLGEVDR